MKLLVLAQTPPPAHGQSVAVAALLEHLRGSREFELHHVNLALSRNAADIGRWRPGKAFAAFRAGLAARRLLAEHGPMPVYYVPAPAKRGALYRDWTVLGLCRRHAAGLILHWHALGLGEWLQNSATSFERARTRRVLGGADLAIIQADAGRADAAVLQPRRLALVRNGIPDPWPDFTPRPAFGRPVELAFVGLGCREKGLFDAVEAVRLANAIEPGAFRLTAIGEFASVADEREFRRVAGPSGDAVRHLGHVTIGERNALLRRADALVFPSWYPHEGQPAVILEALAHDLPVIATRWRGIPELLPAEHVYLTPVRAPAELATALFAARADGAAGGRLRAQFLAHFTLERHHQAMCRALLSWRDTPTATSVSPE